MDLFLKFLILGGKYLSQLTAQSIVEAYRRSIQLGRTLNVHAQHAVAVVSQYDSMLEMYQRNLDEFQSLPNAHLAFISEQHRQEFETYMLEVGLVTDEEINALFVQGAASTDGDGGDQAAYVHQMAQSILGAKHVPIAVMGSQSCQMGDDCENDVDHLSVEVDHVDHNVSHSTLSTSTHLICLTPRMSNPLDIFKEPETECKVNTVAEYLDRQADYIKCANDTFKHLQVDIANKYALVQQQVQEEEVEREKAFTDKLKAVQKEVETCTKLMKHAQDHLDIHEEDKKTKRLFVSIDKIIHDVESITRLMKTNEDHFKECENIKFLREKGCADQDHTQLMDANNSAYHKFICSMVGQQLKQHTLSNNLRVFSTAATSCIAPIDCHILGFLNKNNNIEREKIMEVNQKAFEQSESTMKFPLIGRWNNQLKRSRKSINLSKEKKTHSVKKRRSKKSTLRKFCKFTKTPSLRKFSGQPLHRNGTDESIRNRMYALSSTWIRNSYDLETTLGDELVGPPEVEHLPCIQINSAINRFLQRSSQSEYSTASEGQDTLLVVDEQLDYLVEQMLTSVNDGIVTSGPPDELKMKAISNVKAEIGKNLDNVRELRAPDAKDALSYNLKQMKDYSSLEKELQAKLQECTNPVLPDSPFMYDGEPVEVPSYKLNAQPNPNHRREADVEIEELEEEMREAHEELEAAKRAKTAKDKLEATKRAEAEKQKLEAVRNAKAEAERVEAAKKAEVEKEKKLEAARNAKAEAERVEVVKRAEIEKAKHEAEMRMEIEKEKLEQAKIAKELEEAKKAKAEIEEIEAARVAKELEELEKAKQVKAERERSEAVRKVEIEQFEAARRAKSEENARARAVEEAKRVEAAKEGRRLEVQRALQAANAARVQAMQDAAKIAKKEIDEAEREVRPKRSLGRNAAFQLEALHFDRPTTEDTRLETTTHGSEICVVCTKNNFAPLEIGIPCHGFDSEVANVSVRIQVGPNAENLQTLGEEAQVEEINATAIMKDIVCEMEEKNTILEWQTNNTLLQLACEMNEAAAIKKKVSEEKVEADYQLKELFNMEDRTGENPEVLVADSRDITLLDPVEALLDEVLFEVPEKKKVFGGKWKTWKKIHSNPRKSCKSYTVVKTKTNEITLMDMINRGSRILDAPRDKLTCTRTISFNKSSDNVLKRLKPSAACTVLRKQEQSKDIKLIPMNVLPTGRVDRGVKARNRITSANQYRVETAKAFVKPVYSQEKINTSQAATPEAAGDFKQPQPQAPPKAKTLPNFSKHPEEPGRPVIPTVQLKKVIEASSNRIMPKQQTQEAKFLELPSKSQLRVDKLGQLGGEPSKEVKVSPKQTFKRIHDKRVQARVKSRNLERTLSSTMTRPGTPQKSEIYPLNRSQIKKMMAKDAKEKNSLNASVDGVKHDKKEPAKKPTPTMARPGPDMPVIELKRFQSPAELKCAPSAYKLMEDAQQRRPEKMEDLKIKVPSDMDTMTIRTTKSDETVRTIDSANTAYSAKSEGEPEETRAVKITPQYIIEEEVPLSSKGSRTFGFSCQGKQRKADENSDGASVQSKDLERPTSKFSCQGKDISDAASVQSKDIERPTSRLSCQGKQRKADEISDGASVQSQDLERPTFKDQVCDYDVKYNHETPESMELKTMVKDPTSKGPACDYDVKYKHDLPESIEQRTMENPIDPQIKEAMGQFHNVNNEVSVKSSCYGSKILHDYKADVQFSQKKVAAKEAPRDVSATIKFGDENEKEMISDADNNKGRVKPFQTRNQSSSSENHMAPHTSHTKLPPLPPMLPELPNLENIAVQFADQEKSMKTEVSAENEDRGSILDVKRLMSSGHIAVCVEEARKQESKLNETKVCEKSPPLPALPSLPALPAVNNSKVTALPSLETSNTEEQQNIKVELVDPHTEEKIVYNFSTVPSLIAFAEAKTTDTINIPVHYQEKPTPKERSEFVSHLPKPNMEVTHEFVKQAEHQLKAARSSSKMTYSIPQTWKKPFGVKSKVDTKPSLHSHLKDVLRSTRVQMKDPDTYSIKKFNTFHKPHLRSNRTDFQHSPRQRITYPPNSKMSNGITNAFSSKPVDLEVKPTLPVEAESNKAPINVAPEKPPMTKEKSAVSMKVASASRPGTPPTVELAVTSSAGHVQVPKAVGQENKDLIALKNSHPPMPVKSHTLAEMSKRINAAKSSSLEDITAVKAETQKPQETPVPAMPDLPGAKPFVDMSSVANEMILSGANHQYLNQLTSEIRNPAYHNLLEKCYPKDKQQSDDVRTVNSLMKMQALLQSPSPPQTETQAPRQSVIQSRIPKKAPRKPKTPKEVSAPKSRPATPLQQSEAFFVQVQSPAGKKSDVVKQTFPDSKECFITIDGLTGSALPVVRTYGKRVLENLDKRSREFLDQAMTRPPSPMTVEPKPKTSKTAKASAKRPFTPESMNIHRKSDELMPEYLQLKGSERERNLKRLIILEEKIKKLEAKRARQADKEVPPYEKTLVSVLEEIRCKKSSKFPEQSFKRFAPKISGYKDNAVMGALSRKSYSNSHSPTSELSAKASNHNNHGNGKGPEAAQAKADKTHGAPHTPPELSNKPAKRGKGKGTEANLTEVKTEKKTRQSEEAALAFRACAKTAPIQNPRKSFALKEDGLVPIPIIDRMEEFIKVRKLNAKDMQKQGIAPVWATSDSPSADVHALEQLTKPKTPPISSTTPSQSSSGGDHVQDKFKTAPRSTPMKASSTSQNPSVDDHVNSQYKQTKKTPMRYSVTPQTSSGKEHTQEQLKKIRATPVWTSSDEPKQNYKKARTSAWDPLPSQRSPSEELAQERYKNLKTVPVWTSSISKTPPSDEVPQDKKSRTIPVWSSNSPSQNPSTDELTQEQYKLPLARRKNFLPKIPELKGVDVVEPKKVVLTTPVPKSQAPKTTDTLTIDPPPFRTRMRYITPHDLYADDRYFIASEAESKAEAVKVLADNEDLVVPLPPVQVPEPETKVYMPYASRDLRPTEGDDGAKKNTQFDERKTEHLKLIQNKIREAMQEIAAKQRQNVEQEKTFVFTKKAITPYTNTFGRHLVRLMADSNTKNERALTAEEYEKNLAKKLQRLSSLPRVKEEIKAEGEGFVYHPPADKGGIRDAKRPTMAEMKRTIIRHLAGSTN